MSVMECYVFCEENRWGDSGVRERTGNLLFNLGFWDAALVEFQTAKSLDPLNLTVYFETGMFMAMMGRTTEALEVIDEVRSIEPNFALLGSMLLVTDSYTPGLIEGLPDRIRRGTPRTSWVN